MPHAWNMAFVLVAEERTDHDAAQLAALTAGISLTDLNVMVQSA